MQVLFPQERRPVNSPRLFLMARYTLVVKLFISVKESQTILFMDSQPINGQPRSSTTGNRARHFRHQL